MSENLDRGLYSDGTMGHSGSSTSEERAVRETLSPRRQQVFNFVEAQGAEGAVCKQVMDWLDIGHGSASSALTVLHRGGNIRRLKERRWGQEIYVLPEHVGDREEAPYRPNTNAQRIAELEARVEELSAELRARTEVLRQSEQARIRSTDRLMNVQALLRRRQDGGSGIVWTSDLEAALR